MSIGYCAPRSKQRSVRQGETMKANPPDADPLFQYESQALPTDDARLRKLHELKLAIRNGSYDEQAFLGDLLGKMNNPPPTTTNAADSD